jgi:hypothetical protein
MENSFLSVGNAPLMSLGNLPYRPVKAFPPCQPLNLGEIGDSIERDQVVKNEVALCEITTRILFVESY